MARKKKQESQEEQSRRFKETARELGVDESDEGALDRALRRVLGKEVVMSRRLPFEHKDQKFEVRAWHSGGEWLGGIYDVSEHQITSTSSMTDEVAQDMSTSPLSSGDPVHDFMTMLRDEYIEKNP